MFLTLHKLEKIRDESEYLGMRVTLHAIFDKTKQVLKVDISTGDKITPQAIEYPFKLLLEDRMIPISAYNLETVFAEKMETILSRGTTTTRMRDYYDIYILTHLFEQDIDREVSIDSFKETSQQRNSYFNIAANSSEYLKNINESDELAKLWELYIRRNQ